MRLRCCLVTDRGVAGDGWKQAIPALAGRAGEAGVDLIQVREPGLDARDLAALVADCRVALAGSATRLLVNDRLDVALGEGADGVHLPERGLAVGDVRRVAPGGFLIGQSIHPGSELSVSDRPDFAIFGTVFPSTSKPGVVAAGLGALADAVAASGVPVLAIGGVDEARLADLARTGASGVAAIRWLSVPSVAELRRRVRLVADAFDTLAALP